MPDITQISSPLLEKLPLALMMADRAGHVLYGNARACAMTGYSAAELAATRLGRLFTTQGMLPTVDAATTQALPEHEATPSCTTTLRRRDGLGLPVRLYRENLEWDGVPYELIALHDRTHEELMREQAEISAMIVQATDRGIVVLDAQYRITHANAAIATMLGVERDALHGAPFGTLLAGAENDIGTLRQFRAHLARRTGFEVDVQARGPQGVALWRADGRWAGFVPLAEACALAPDAQAAHLWAGGAGAGCPAA